MEIRVFAEQVLFGTALVDKLHSPEMLTDEQPGIAIALPPEPPRPPGLALVRRARIGFPAVAHLDRSEVRGQALHHFAHHELLAMELMALALLRFPEAPTAFRRGLAAALREEQAHFQLYTARMAACGVALGEVPASALFWDALSPMASPLDFVTGMSLTFEQANLDYAGFYRRAFAAVGDHETAAVLQQVYEDEIGHVKLGLVWFRRWLGLTDSEDSWTAYTGALPESLQPSRAKGLDFDAEARRRAGFDEAFIQQLRVFTRSKGRVPDLHIFNPTAEISLIGGLPPVALQLERDLAGLPMFLCASDDVVQTEQPPRAAFLEPLAAAGFALPEFIRPAEVKNRRFRCQRHWAEPTTPRALFDKGWAADQLRKLLKEGLFSDELLVGRACLDVGAVEAHCAQLRAAGHPHIVAKCAFGTAGRGLIHLGEELPQRRLERALGMGPLVVEPWLDRVLDLGMQIHVDEEVRFDGLTRNLVDARGQHRGVALIKRAAGLPHDLRKWFMSEAVRASIEATAQHVGRALYAAGHRGPAGIDALVYRSAEGYRLKPIVEVNPRTTMGRIALALQRRLAPGTAGVWLQMAAKQAPVPHLRTRGHPPQIEDAVLFTTDPLNARFTTVLFVAPSLEVLRQRLGPLPTVDPAFC